MYTSSPLPRRSDGRSCFAHPFRRISLPRYGRRVGQCIDLFEVYSAFTCVTACTLALSPYVVTCFTQRLQPFCCLHSCSGCFRLEQFAGRVPPTGKAPPLHGARQDRSFSKSPHSGHWRLSASWFLRKKEAVTTPSSGVTLRLRNCVERDWGLWGY